jgi:SAM-dependent methyltransferase
MQERHIDKDMYFKEQEYTTQKYVIPFISDFCTLNKDFNVLEIGCGEAGNLKPFLDIGCPSMGVDLNRDKVEYAKELFSSHPNKHILKLVVEDIYNMEDELKEEFDLIILRDVIEHIHNQEKFLISLKKFLKPNGRIFFGFPPWQNPFGGHQQVCRSKVLSKMPYFHLLPKFLYSGVLKLFGEQKATIVDLLEIKDTGISIERFERILKKENWKIDKKMFYFINPNYEIKFKLKPRESYSFISKVPVVRNFFTTACYYLISKK